MNDIFDFMQPFPTPKMNYGSEMQHPPVPRIDCGGIYHNCYICGIELSRLGEENVVRKLHEYQVYQDKILEEERYFTMSFCWRCANTHLDKT